MGGNHNTRISSNCSIHTITSHFGLKKTKIKEVIMKSDNNRIYKPALEKKPTTRHRMMV